MAFFCVYRSLHHLLKMSTDTAFDLGVTNHAVKRGVLLGCLLCQLQGLLNSQA